MTYARSRLWLGISGVGSLVILAGSALWSDLPVRFLADENASLSVELMQLAFVTAAIAIWLVPFDFLGGFWLPRTFDKSNATFSRWLRDYLRAAITQGLLFIGFGALIVSTTQSLGPAGGVLAVLMCFCASLAIRNFEMRLRRVESIDSRGKLLDALALIQSWQVFVPKTMIVAHYDPGFTGGIIGVGKRVKIVIPKAWLRFSTEQLATSIGRRALAVQTGSYQRGLLTAFAWNLGGFFACSMLSSTGLATIAGLVTTICWFTLWSFLGLLILPTLSRNASLRIDQLLRKRGASPDWILRTTFTMDQLQDGEPERPRLIEAIFHPIPSVASRSKAPQVAGFTAWNVARTSLFFSWACLGFLSRAVHCNVGRPELWTMLPSD